jgi:two-component system, NtrC family, response regulator AtoC
MSHILVVDDQIGSRESIKAIFSKTHEVSLTESAEGAMKILSEKRVDIILLDVMMPDKDGLTFLQEAKSIYPDVPVIMVSAAISVKPIVQAIRSGAYDYVTKPFDVDELRRIVERALETFSLYRRVEVLQTEVSQEFPVNGIVGQSPSFMKALADVQSAAASDSTVLIYGESGTGKELIARVLHDLSKRRVDPFIAVHCAALPESLMESELFGYEKGAFTNADKQKLGRFDLAGSGTLFFDEVGEMSLATQVKLLRVLQEREYMRVGGAKVIRTNARIVTATARDLLSEVREKRFRDDLYYRLSVVPIRLPPLRERAEDIPLLAHHFLNYFKQRISVKTKGFEPELMERLSSYSWPGNIRELRNIIERLLVLHGSNEFLKSQFLPEEFGVSSKSQSGMTNYRSEAGESNFNLEEATNRYEKELIEKALQEAGGVQTQAAELLGTTRRILKYRMEKLGLAAKL